MREPQVKNSVTLEKVFEDYQRLRKVKPSTISDYRKRLQSNFQDWLQLPVREISKDIIENRHAEISLRGKSQANLCMRLLRALINFAINRYDDLAGTANPVKRLSECRSWNKVQRRRTWIDPHRMPDWSAGVSSLKSRTVRDYLLFLMFTGCRRNEARMLAWDTVDLEARTVTFENTKNGLNHTLPLSDFLADMLRERRAQRSTNPFVFPGRIEGAPLSGTLKSYDRAFKNCGFRFKLHDLRRTFITTAADLGLPMHTIKRLANHASNDVTEGYIVQSVESLRQPMQLISDDLVRRSRRYAVTLAKNSALPGQDVPVIVEPVSMSVDMLIYQGKILQELKSGSKLRGQLLRKSGQVKAADLVRILQDLEARKMIQRLPTDRGELYSTR